MHAIDPSSSYFLFPAGLQTFYNINFYFGFHWIIFFHNRHNNYKTLEPCIWSQSDICKDVHSCSCSRYNHHLAQEEETYT